MKNETKAWLAYANLITHETQLRDDLYLVSCCHFDQREKSYSTMERISHMRSR
jgi:hypothetical protein